MPISVFDSECLQHLWSTPETRDIFSERNRIKKWLAFEAALAEAQAELNIIPAEAAKDIVNACNIDKIDITKIGEGIREIKHAFVPALKQIQANCTGNNGEWLHFGATTQDVLDTGVVLQLKEVHALIMRDLKKTGAELKRLALEHKNTIMVGRTHGVQALPITFGHKCAIWLDELSRHHERLTQAEPRVFVGMLVGAVGSQASLGNQAKEVERLMLRKLGLQSPSISWAPARDRLTEYVLLLSMLGATISKIGNELFNMQRNEINEVEEAFSEGKLGSSTMPHKRNPVAAENLAGLGRPLRYNAAMMLESMVQEGERDGISWKIEWKVIPETCLITAAMLSQSCALFAGLKVNADAMTKNLHLLEGYLLSERVMLVLSERVGKQTAHKWIYQASMNGLSNQLSFLDALKNHAELSDVLTENELKDLTNPADYLGQCEKDTETIVKNATWA